MLSREQPLMSLLQRSVPAKNSQYQDLFVEAGLKDANTFSFRKVHTNESESATLELTVYESQIKLPYDTRNPQKDFENWLRKILRLKDDFPVTKSIDTDSVPNVNLITYSLSANELVKIDKIIVDSRMKMLKKTGKGTGKKDQVRPKDIDEKEEIRGTTLGRVGFKYLDSDGKVISSSLKTSRALAVESEQREKKQEQPVAEKEKLREGAKKLLKEQEEKADLQVKQYLNEQKKLQEEEERHAELIAVQHFFRDPETITDLQGLLKSNYDLTVEEKQIKLLLSDDRRVVKCEISLTDEMLMVIEDLDEWMDDEFALAELPEDQKRISRLEKENEKNNKKIADSLTEHFTKYKDYLEKKRSFFDLGRYLLIDSDNKLRIVQALLKKLEKTEGKTYTNLVDDFRDYYNTEDIETKLKKDRYRSEAISFTVFMFKQLIPSFIYNDEQAKTEGEKAVTDKKVTDIIKPPGLKR